MKLNKSTKKIIIFALIIIAVVIANHFLGLSSYLKMAQDHHYPSEEETNLLLEAYPLHSS